MNEAKLRWISDPHSSTGSGDVADELLTVREAQALLKIGRTKLWQLTRTHAVPAYRLGDGKSAPLRYKRSELLGWLERHRL